MRNLLIEESSLIMDPNPKKIKFIDENTGVLEISESTIVFTPPLYRQRYQKVKEKIESFSHGTYTKVLDLGCSDLKFFRYLRDIPGIQEIVLLDKDEATLKDNIHHLKPMVGDYIMMRTEPLVVKAVCGDATVFNQVMKGTQVITMIELIEHMYPSELPRLVDNVFRKLRPKVVIITTPNADFNQFIPDFVPGTFRHWDHKFEWTGEEFQNWCHGVVQDTLDYTVQISGCGLGPDDTYCSQMAVFVRSTSDVEESLALSLRNISIDTKGNVAEPVARRQYDIQDYLVPRDKARIISEVSYPVDTRTQEEKDQHFTLHKFHTLVSYLQLGEDNQNSYLDWRGEGEEVKGKEEEESDGSADHCDWSPIPLNGLTVIDESHNLKPIRQTSFRCLHIGKEDEIQWKDVSEDCHVFYIVNHRYAVFSMSSLSTWVNLDSDRKIPSNLIRSTVEAECFDCSGDGDNWKGKTILWEDSDSSNEDCRQDDEGDNGNEEYKVWSVCDETNWACDTWEDVDGSSVVAAKQPQEEDWGWGESDGSHGSDWGS